MSSQAQAAAPAGTAAPGGSNAGNNNPPRSKRPKHSKFTQQELPACKPLLTPGWVILIFFVVGVIFVPIGGITLNASRSVVELVKRYDDICVGGETNGAREDNFLETNGTGTTCDVNFTIPEDMDGPVYLYYELENFYQNHRRYVKSRSDAQLRNDKPNDVSTCDPQDYLYGNESEANLINPCGLVAWSYFNDTYSLTRTDNDNVDSSVTVLETGIAWDSDVKEKFGPQNTTNFNTNPALAGGGTITGPLNKDEHFVVWMRTAALPKFRKLWGRIVDGFKQGEKVRISIANRYNTYSFGGKKRVVLSTTSWLGGRNDFLGIAYLTVGSTCIVLSFIFWIIRLKNPRPLGSVDYLSWNKKAGGVGH